MSTPGRGHGIVVRTFRTEPDAAGELQARWFAVAEAVPEGLARTVVARGELPGSAAARREHVAGAWPVETTAADFEADAILEAIRRLLARGLEEEERRG